MLGVFSYSSGERGSVGAGSSSANPPGIRIGRTPAIGEKALVAESSERGGLDPCRVVSGSRTSFPSWRIVIERPLARTVFPRRHVSGLKGSSIPSQTDEGNEGAASAPGRCFPDHASLYRTQISVFLLDG